MKNQERDRSSHSRFEAAGREAGERQPPTDQIAVSSAERLGPRFRKLVIASSAGLLMAALVAIFDDCDRHRSRRQSLPFFRVVSIDFLTDTMWMPLFAGRASCRS
jgi:hypothetical protein